MNKRVIFLLLAGITFASVAFYFFILPYEFKVRLAVRTLPGDVIQTIRLWSRARPGLVVQKVEDFDRLVQEVSIDDRTYTFEWEFEMENDSTTAIEILISEHGQEFTNKLFVPFKDLPIEQHGAVLAKDFLALVKEHLAITRVNIIGPAVFDSALCICRTISVSQIDKANGMMKNFLPMTSFITTQNLKSTGRPVLRVQRWNHDNAELDFQFCFPVENISVQLPGGMEYVKLPSFRALKAEYFGNYITSDRAWYELKQYAAENGYEVVDKPVEVFNDNPSLGIDELKWKAEVYLPIK